MFSAIFPIEIQSCLNNRLTRILLLTILAGCQTRSTFDPTSLGKIELPQKELPRDLLLFRSTLATQARSEISETDFRRLALVPTKDFFEPKQNSFEEITNFFEKKIPETLYTRSLATAEDLVQPLEEQSKEAVTLILIPGFLSELTPQSMFPEALDAEASIFAKEVRSRFSKATNQQKNDHRYSLAELGEIDAPLSDLIRAGSIDVDGKKDAIRVIYLVPSLGSLESVGSMYRLYPIYKRRLDKFFKIMGTTSNIYISGHSRGAAVALDFLARVSKDQAADPWAKEIKGFVSLNGALFGSHYANAYYNAEKRPHYLYTEFSRLKNLRGGRGVIDSIIDRNTILSSLNKLGSEAINRESMKYENWSIPLPDVIQGTSILRKYYEELRPNSYFADYERYIQRIRFLAEATETAIFELTHEERLKWWKSNTLPSEIPYFSFSSTMASPMKQKIASGYQKALIESPFMGRNVPDYAVIRTLFYDYASDRGISLNDGLIGIHESTFWPKLHVALNPRQKEYQASSLGVFAAHHLAIGYASVSSGDRSDRNPFPRAALLRALSIYLNSQKSLKSGLRPTQIPD
jgi:hypothetical protein